MKTDLFTEKQPEKATDHKKKNFETIIAAEKPEASGTSAAAPWKMWA